MASCSRGATIRSIATAVLGLAAVGLVAGCGGNDGSSDEAVRLGCGSYCQSAGGYGGQGEGQPAVTIDSSGTATADADGYVPVTLTCNLPMQCEGRILVQLPDSEEGGRSDLAVDAGATRTFGVPLPASILSYLRSHGPTPLVVTADNRGVPDCQDIPQLAAKCAEFTSAPEWTGEKGDGIIRVVTGKLTVAAPE